MQKTQTTVFLVALLIVFFGFAPSQAVVPPPDGGSPNFTTAEGQNALLHLSTGVANTAVGWLYLETVTTASANTAVGAGTLALNTADENTATGAGALLSNTTGNSNTANGAFNLFSNTVGLSNTAFGRRVMDHNTSGSFNTAIGNDALCANTTGSNNTVIGANALSFSTGDYNIALGIAAGNGVTTASNVIAIGTDGNDVNDSCYVGNVFGATSPSGIGVFVNSNGRLGTATSSKRFKEQIRPIGKANKALFCLKPVTFHYKKEVDPEGEGKSQYGLVAEDVEKVNPDLVVRDKEGKPYSVRYDQVNAMLLNEFLKEHRKVEQQRRDFEAALAQQQKQIEALTAGLQKVSARLELKQLEPQTACLPTVALRESGND